MLAKIYLFWQEGFLSTNVHFEHGVISRTDCLEFTLIYLAGGGVCTYYGKKYDEGEVFMTAV